jgi:hypothetical protein
MIPSGYKEDVVYSPIPTDGSGDLSFTRASNGTRVNSAGLVEVCPWNMVLDSETFNSGNWSKYQASVTASTTNAPNGTLTADTLQDNAANDSHITYQTPNITAGTYTISVYAKASTLSNINLVLFDGVSISYGSNRFDLSNGTTTGANQSIESVGNGWYRCIFTLTTTLSGVQYVYVFLNNGTSSVYTGTGSGAVFIWGYQLNIGSTAKPYFPTTDRLNVPRLTYQNGGGGCPSLLLEKQSTNLCLYSEQFDNAAYNKISGGSATVPVVTANFATSPDGSQNADRIQFARTGTTASDFSAINQSSLTLSATGTTTIYLKSNTSSNQNVLMYWGGGQGQVFLVTPSWQRFTLSNLSVGTDAIVFGTRGGTGNFFNGGDLTLDILAWGAQLEQSSYPTSYIPTTSSSATRVADACSKTGISSLIGQTEGTMFVQVTAKYKNADIASINTGTTNAIYIVKTSNNYYRATIYAGGVAVVTITQGAVIETSAKIAVVYKSGSTSLFVNGSKIGANTTTYTFTTALNSFYLQPNYLVGFETNEVQQSCLFPTALTDAECQALTTL